MHRLTVRINIKNYTFVAKFYVILLFLVLLGLFLWLGSWQLDRSAQKKQILTVYQKSFQAAPIPLIDVSSQPSQYRFQAVKIRGTYNNKKQFLLDNRFYKHRLGYHVLTAFKPNNSNHWLLVDRGWIERGSSRQQLPSLSSIPNPQTIIGRVYIPSTKQRVLNDEQDNPHAWPRLIQKIDFFVLAKMFGKPLYPFIVRLEPQQRFGDVRDWPLVNVLPAKHTAYAVQWFAFAMVLIILFVALHIKRRELR